MIQFTQWSVKTEILNSYEHSIYHDRSCNVCKITEPPIATSSQSFVIVLLKYQVNRVYMLNFGSIVDSNVELNLIVHGQKVYCSW